MRSVKLKPGDILLLPTKYTEVYMQIANVLGAKVSSFLPKLLNEPYLHAELYIGRGYTIGAWLTGVHVHRYPLSTQMRFDIFRHKDNEASDKIKEVILEDFENYLNKRPTKFLNRPYDFQTLFYNTIAELASFLKHEKTVEANLPAPESPDIFICSELVARIYHEAGYDIAPKEKSLEWVSPTDLAESPYLYKIYGGGLDG
jgi:uncharacterized protein YycO